MSTKKTTLTDAKWELMRVLWTVNAASSKEIISILQK